MDDQHGPFFGQKWTTLHDFAYKISRGFSAQSGVGARSCDPRCLATPPPPVLGRRHQFPFGSPAFSLILPVLRNDHWYNGMFARLPHSAWAGWRCSLDGYHPRPQPIFTARAYARAVLGVVILSVRPSVCLSVTRVHCGKTKWRTADILMPHERAITLLLCHQEWLVGDAPFPLKYAFKVTHPLRKTPTLTDFRS